MVDVDLKRGQKKFTTAAKRAAATSHTDVARQNSMKC
jgi:hypothetical protein